MGLNSGEVVVGKIGDDLRMDYMAQGHTVGLAARMEQMADPGKALLTGHTAKLVSGYFQLRDLGETRIKGLSDLLHVFELEGVVSGSGPRPGNRRERRWSASSATPASGRAGSAKSSCSAAVPAASRSTKRTAWRTGRWSG